MMRPRVPLDSKALRSAAYDAETETLEIEFATGSIYQYVDVPADVYTWLLKAKSKGRYVTDVISKKFEFRQIGLPATPDDALESALAASIKRNTPEMD